MQQSVDVLVVRQTEVKDSGLLPRDALFKHVYSYLVVTIVTVGQARGATRSGSWEQIEN